MAGSLSTVDYVVFALMLALSSVIGVYYGIKGRNKNTTEYLTASRSMHWLPISISMLASFISAIALLGIPAETYTFGIQYLLNFFAIVMILSTAALVYAPIFYNTGVASAHEYLERRFNYPVRLMGCTLFILQQILYLGVVIYAPSLALQAVAGVPMAVSMISTGVVCTFYTTLGGMRGVVWTDVFQTIVMLLGLVVVVIIGTNEVGGFSNVVDISREGKRLVLFDFNPDPTVRNTFWSIVIGGALTFFPTWTTSQVVVQRFLSASSLRNVKKALWANVLFFLVFYCLSCFAGLVMYAVYHQCDLRSVKAIKSNDQIIPYFVIHKLSYMKGVTGIYVACLYSGALSSASSVLNSLTAVIIEDIVKRKWPNMNDNRVKLLSKLIACGFGVLVICLSFLISIIDTAVLQLGYAIAGMLASPSFGLFTLGMFSKRANSKGALVGALFGLTMSAWISLGSTFYPGDKRPAPIKVTNCSSIGLYNNTGFTLSGSSYEPYDFLLAKLYSLSHYWYGPIGILSTILVGWLVSVITAWGKEEQYVDPKLLFHFRSSCKGSSSSEQARNKSSSESKNMISSGETTAF